MILAPIHAPAGTTGQKGRTRQHEGSKKANHCDNKVSNHGTIVSANGSFEPGSTEPPSPTTPGYCVCFVHLITDLDQLVHYPHRVGSHDY